MLSNKVLKIITIYIYIHIYKDQIRFELCTIYFFSTLEKLGSSSDPWTIFANKNILFLNRVKIEVIKNTVTSTSNFSLLK